MYNHVHHRKYCKDKNEILKKKKKKNYKTIFLK